MASSLLLLLCSIAIAAILAGYLFQQFGLHLDKRRFPPPGEMIGKPNRARLHVQTSGLQNGPVVLLEAGIAATSLSWALVQRQLKSFATVISYDRVGLGWSDPAQTPITVASLTSDLVAVLDAVDATGPVLFVAHSFGALPVRAFAHLYPDRVGGIVLVDPVCIDAWANCTGEAKRRLALGVRLARRGALLARLGLVRAALALLAAGSRSLPRLINRASSRAGRAVVERLLSQVRKMPQESWNAIRAHWSNPQSFEGMAYHLECLPSLAEAVAGMPVPRRTPMTVLSAASATETELAERDRWLAAHPFARHVHTTGTGHWLQLERPDLVVEAVREMMSRTEVEAKPPRVGAEGMRAKPSSRSMQVESEQR